MVADGDDPDVRQEVTAGRDAIVAGGNINFVPPPEIQPVERKLAQVVLQQAQDARSVLIGTDRPGSETANVEYTPMPGRLREADGRDIGDLRSILEYYRSLSPPRLVIIGAPGAGKTVLLLELQIRLLMEGRKNPESPIPVLISASACDTTKKWEDWLAAHLSLRFSIPERTAADLIAAHRILPIVDGLDEMDPTGNTIYPERAMALVKSLNDSMRFLDRAPVVVTSRPGEYARLAEGIDKARHVELSALTGTEAADYLESQFRRIDERDRWTPVLESLKGDPDGPLATELSTPWRLTLALATFRAEGDPAQLLPPTGITDSGYSTHVDRMLLGNYVSTVVSLHEETTPYTEPKVRRWLTNLADDLAWQARHGRSATDITLHEWWHFRETRIAQIPSAILMLLPGLTSIVIDTANGSTFLAGFLAIFALSISRPFLPRKPNSKQMAKACRLTTILRSPVTFGLACVIAGVLTGGFLNWIIGFFWGTAIGLFLLTRRFVANRKNGFSAGLTAGIMIMLVTVLAGWFILALGFIFAPVTGLAAGLMNGLTTGLMNSSPKVLRPHAVIRTNGLAGLAGGLAMGLTAALIIGLGTWFAFGLTDGIAFGLTFGLTVWLAVSGRIWVRYHIVVAWNALRGRGPLRFGKFLDWTVTAGLLRESGVSYQFRHRQLQDWFTG